jgi:hypothetical protein
MRTYNQTMHSRLALVWAAALSAACASPSSSQDAASADAAITDAVTADAVTGDVPGLPPPGPYAPHEPRLRRLTQRQYRNTILDVLGATVVVPRSLEPDNRAEGSSSIGGTETSISQRGTEQYADAAYDLAEQVLRDPARRAAVLGCAPSGVRDDACAGRFVTEVGRRLWRRPLTEGERAGLVAIAGRAAETLRDFHRGLEFALAGLLQSPDFLFRGEVGTVRGGERRFEGYELASRLAYFLWDGPPDDALLDAAGAGDLEREEGLRAQVDRMLASPKARRGFEAFVTDWLRLDDLDNLSRDARLFPSFAADFGPSAREEVLRTAAWIGLEQDRDFRDLLVTRETFVNRRLAALYGVTFPVRDAAPTQFERVEFSPSQPRRGILGMAGFLALEAHPTSTSPTLRGKFIREALLCETIPAPPVGVNTAIPEPSATARTLRERLAAHQEAPSCRGCHRLTDNIGLGFESFDALGRYRREDNGVLIDPSGTLDAIPFRDAAEFAIALREQSAFSRCLVNRLYRHAWGWKEAEPQRAELDRLHGAFASEGFRVRALLRTIATGEAFRRAGALEVPPLPPLPATDAGVTDGGVTDAGVTDAGTTMEDAG